jgi:hypothetical protein
VTIQSHDIHKQVLATGDTPGPFNGSLVFFDKLFFIIQLLFSHFSSFVEFKFHDYVIPPQRGYLAYSYALTMEINIQGA